MAQMPYMARPQGCLKANVGQSIESIDGFFTQLPGELVGWALPFQA